ncbi:hypothetical protein FRC98_03075 [Lujinxingia vulgaris]|uniref:DUF4382 domain-containing protein n=1 Tax=Lujinxingia vulgaris TaxID=2600176 RepID=A0A5C6XG17_9DELT|nr:hypothetical protein [Lujinxingia vulgaris]TXD39393.1 hypothetical protein FRC98_03075 [Lujinxingia vulgaris]
MKMSNAWMVWLASAALLGTAACGGETDEEVDAGVEADADAGDDEAGEYAEEPEFEAQYDMRFNAFAFEQGTPGFSLNSPLEYFLDQSLDYPVVVLVELRDIDTAAGTLQVRGGAGLKTATEGEYVWDEEVAEPEAVAGTIAANGDFEATLPLLSFVATVESGDEINKTVIPIRDLAIDAKLQASAAGENPVINDGMLSGFVLLSEIEDVGLTIVPGQNPLPLTQLFGGPESVNYDYDEDGENDAWQLSATFSAEQTVIVE